MKNYNGFSVSDSEYDDLIKNYYFIANLDELLVIDVRNASFAYIKSAITTIDNFILNIDYEPEVSNENLKTLATAFYTSSIVKESFDNDFEALEQSLEIVCGITCQIKQKIVFQIIDLCMLQIQQLMKLLYH